MALVSFGGFTPENPTSYQVNRSDIDSENSGRTAKGVMQRDRIRGGDDAVYKLEIGWEYLTDAQMKALLNSVKGETVSTTFYFGESITKEMYAGDRSIKLQADSPEYKWSVNFNMTEV